jgi:hypothetical protein
VILAIDPGSAKSGLAVLDEDRRVLYRSVTLNADLPGAVTPLLTTFRPTAVVIGRGHFGRKLAHGLTSQNLVFISEKDSTRLGRQRYWRENPPRGLLRLIPTSFLVPPVPIDDWAAVVIGERYLNS